MNRERFADFLTQTRLNVDPEEDVIFINDGAPAHNNPLVPAANTELKKLPPCSPFLNIVEQAISALKGAIKAYISRPEFQYLMGDREAARNRQLRLGEFRMNLLKEHCRETLVQQLLLNAVNGTE